jgi:hypothetical protein
MGKNTEIIGKVATEEESVNRIPEAMAKGSVEVEVLKHSLLNKENCDVGVGKGANVVLKNISGRYIYEVKFTLVFYDMDGDVLEETELKIENIEKDQEYSINIVSALSEDEDISSYALEIGEAKMTPQPKAVGNETIEITSHSFLITEGEDTAGVEFSVKNISNKTIARAVFQVEFMDHKGGELETVWQKEQELEPQSEKSIVAKTEKDGAVQLKTYKITVYKVVTSDVEKVLLYGHEMTDVEGKKKITGTLKNISSEKTTAALVATCIDENGEKVGTRVVMLENLEPWVCKQFKIIFEVPEGDNVSSYTLRIGKLTEEAKKEEQTD